MGDMYAYIQKVTMDDSVKKEDLVRIAERLIYQGFTVTLTKAGLSAEKMHDEEAGDDRRQPHGL